MSKLIIAFLSFAILSLDTNAQLLDWVGQLGGTNYVYANKVAVDASGNVYSTGFFKGTADFDPGAGTANLISSGTTDAYISKLDASGNYVWTKKFSGSANTVGTAIAVDESGNIYTTGRFEGTADFDPGNGISNLMSAGQFDIFVTKLDVNGDFVWAKRIGGTSTNWVNALFLDSGGNIYTTGFFEGTSDFDPGNNTTNLTSAGDRDIFVSKLDANGDFVWAGNMGGSSTDTGTSISVDASSNVYTTGFFQSTADFDPGVGISNLVSTGTNNVFISKLDASGNFVWAKRAEGAYPVSGNGITVDPSGTSYTTGSFGGIMDFDSGAGIANLTSAGEFDVYVLKLDASGNYIWAKNMGGTDFEIPRSISIDETGSVFTTGYFKGTADFDPGAGQTNISSSGSWDVFVSKLSPLGNYAWAVQMGGTGDDFAESIAVDQNGNIFTTGYFQETVDFDPGSGVLNLSTSVSSIADAFVHKMNSVPVGIIENSFDLNIRAFPNPTTDKIWISFDQAYNNLQVKIYDSVGQLVFNEQITQSNIIPLDLDYPSGIYLVEVSSLSKRAILKIIKQ